MCLKQHDDLKKSIEEEGHATTLSLHTPNKTDTSGALMRLAILQLLLELLRELLDKLIGCD